MISADGAAPRFTYGTTGVFQGAARFFSTIGDLDASSNYNADGTITLVLPKELFRSKAVCAGACNPLAPGQSVSIALGSVRFSPPSEVPGSGGTNETIPDTTGAASYALRPANLCLPNTAPMAAPETGMLRPYDRTPLSKEFLAGYWVVDVETEARALQIAGRKKDVIIRGGHNIYPVRIEDTPTARRWFGDGVAGFTTFQWHGDTFTIGTKPWEVASRPIALTI